MRRFVALLALSLLAACAPTEEEAGPTDLRREFPPAAAGAAVFTSPEYVIPAGTERQFCFVTTYEGPEAAITAEHNYQSPSGHHVVVFGTSATERDLPDGTSWDCTESESLDMAAMEPIIIGGDIASDADGVTNEFFLPDGMGALLRSGQRLVVQSHYLNVRTEDVLVQDQAQLDLIPPEQVDTWTAPLINTVTDFVIPAQTEGFQVQFDCGFDESYSLLYLGGHLHEWGASFKTERTNASGTETVYEVEQWEPVLRDSPTYLSFERDEFVVTPDDTFTTTCVWDNPDDQDIGFPQEMCVTFAMVYPAQLPVICDPS